METDRNVDDHDNEEVDDKATLKTTTVVTTTTTTTWRRTYLQIFPIESVISSHGISIGTVRVAKVKNEEEIMRFLIEWATTRRRQLGKILEHRGKLTHGVSQSL